MNLYEGVLNCYLTVIKISNSSLAEVDEMPLDLVLDLISVYCKINEVGVGKSVYIDDLL